MLRRRTHTKLPLGRWTTTMSSSLVMPFGLTNAPSTFQSAMNDLLRPYLRRFVLVFFDDILVYSSSIEMHLHHLKIILETLLTNSFYAKLPKCEFGVSKVNYLGHVISSAGVELDQTKVQVIRDWSPPHNLTTLRGFLGLTGFYRRFMRHYATLASPLTDLLKQGPKSAFKWTPEAEKAFNSLKSLITEAPILILLDFKQPFDVETDASGVAIGAVLSQKGHPWISSAGK